ncbi:MAG: DUF6688 family protein [Planctomycetota bacterium]
MNDDPTQDDAATASADLKPSAGIDTDLVCVTCGYKLRGLQPGGACPECGRPIAESLLGVGAIREDATIDTDLACWQCAYNLRTLSINGECPECGFSVAESVERARGRRAKRFSLHTLSPASRIFGWVVGLLAPAGVVLLASIDPMATIFVEWQSGRTEDYVGTMLAGRAMWAFYPLLVWAYVAFGALLVQPVAMARRSWVRVGLILGVLLGVQYQLILTISFVGLDGVVVPALIGVIVLSAPLTLAIGLSLAERQEGYTPPPRPKPSMAWRTVAIVAASLFCAAWISVGIVFALFLSPYAMAFCMLAALCRVYRTDFDEPPEPARPVSVTLAAAGYAAAWPIAISQAMIVYSSLPTHPPHCYVVTASARGHRWLTRPLFLTLDAKGRPFPVTRQMLVLKRAELAIAARCPGLHRAMRRVYDRIGPAIARRITNPWLADASYLLFALPAWVASWFVSGDAVGERRGPTSGGRC